LPNDSIIFFSTILLIIVLSVLIVENIYILRLQTQIVITFCVLKRKMLIYFSNNAIMLRLSASPPTIMGWARTILFSPTSYIHEKTIVMGKPKNKRMMIMRPAQSGMPNMGKTISIICIMTKATTA